MEWLKYPENKPEFFKFYIVSCLRKGTGEPSPFGIASYDQREWRFIFNSFIDASPTFSGMFSPSQFEENEITHFMKLNEPTEYWKIGEMK